MDEFKLKIIKNMNDEDFYYYYLKNGYEDIRIMLCWNKDKGFHFCNTDYQIPREDLQLYFENKLKATK